MPVMSRCLESQFLRSLVTFVTRANILNTDPAEQLKTEGSMRAISKKLFYFGAEAQRGYGFLIHEVSRSHTTHHIR
jgi:hypothetical protein